MGLEALSDFNAVASHGDFSRASRVTDVQLEIIADDRFIDPLTEGYDAC